MESLRDPNKAGFIRMIVNSMTHVNVVAEWGLSLADGRQ
jgi:hypothetical protein